MSKTIFKVYDVSTNSYVDLPTLNEVKAKKQELINKFLADRLQDANGQFSVTAVNIDDNGNEVWSEVTINAGMTIQAPYEI